MAKIMLSFVTAVCVLLSLSTAYAQSLGLDMWTMEMQRNGLFITHVNDCDSSTEVFVAVGSVATKGFCMEKTTRSAATFEVARQDCASDNKRLPEPAELKWACNNPPSGLSGLPSSNWEWASNFLVNYEYQASASSFNFHISGVLGGNTNCTFGALADMTGNTSATNETPFGYRCVR